MGFTQFRNYLIKHKNDTFQGAPASDEAYVSWWKDALEKDLQEIQEEGKPWVMSFKPFQKDGPLLVMEKNGKVPEKYLKKFEAYKDLGSKMGLKVEITSKIIPAGPLDPHDGMEYIISVS